MSRRSSKKNNMASDRYWQSRNYNQRVYIMYRDWIYALAMNRFKWLGLPKTCDARFLEYTLLTQGVATITQIEKGSNIFFSTQAVLDGNLNVYDNPATWQSFGNNGWTFNSNPNKGVLVYDNQMRRPIINAIDLLARRLAAFDRTIDINLQKQHTPWILTAASERKNDVVQLLKQVEGGEPAVIGTDGLSDLVDGITALNVNVPFIGEELQTAQLNEWGKVYALLGINSLPKKAERMIEDEVNANNEPTNLLRLNVLDSRRAACNVLNDRFNLNVNVVWNTDIISDNYNVMHNFQTFEKVTGGNNGVE